MGLSTLTDNNLWPKAHAYKEVVQAWRSLLDRKKETKERKREKTCQLHPVGTQEFLFRTAEPWTLPHLSSMSEWPGVIFYTATFRFFPISSNWTEINFTGVKELPGNLHLQRARYLAVEVLN